MARGRVYVGRRPHECDGIDMNTNSRKRKLRKCENVAKWRIRIPGTGDRQACDKHKNLGIFLGPLKSRPDDVSSGHDHDRGQDPE